MLMLPTKYNSLLVILEPGNIRKMKELFPLEINIPADCKRVGIVLANDIEWVEKECQKRSDKDGLSLETLNQIMEEDLKNKPIDRGEDPLEGVSRLVTKVTT